MKWTNWKRNEKKKNEKEEKEEKKKGMVAWTDSPVHHKIRFRAIKIKNKGTRALKEWSAQDANTKPHIQRWK